MYESDSIEYEDSLWAQALGQASVVLAILFLIGLVLLNR